MVIDQTGSVTNIMLVLVGTLVVSIHVMLAFAMKGAFGLLVGFYVIGFCSMALSFIKKKKVCISSTENDIAIYLTWFVIAMQVILLIMFLAWSLS
jgi:hypothetical protein